VALLRSLTGVGRAGNVAYVIVAGILAVEEIEEFGEGAELDSFSQIDVAADAEIHLVERSAAELVKVVCTPLTTARSLPEKPSLSMSAGVAMVKGRALSNCERVETSKRQGVQVPIRTKRCRTSSPDGP